MSENKIPFDEFVPPTQEQLEAQAQPGAGLYDPKYWKVRLIK